ncbi:MAG: hypothetical protein AYK22_04955 [Thermoplasmatales archaeon SG8-52-3]|nr:MAG: hypothetical protein AYK22_04955 [Thermoplasmatales archaeon SG8-52-3]
MKRIKTIFLVAILVISTTYVLGVAAESVFMNNQQKIEYNDIDNTPIFFTEITFTIMINDGCGCNPIEGVSVSAFGGAGNDQNVTDINGKCILLLEINSEYTVSITHDEYIPVLFDFVVIDEQFFVFQMTLKDESVHSLTPVLNHNTILTIR